MNGVLGPKEAEQLLENPPKKAFVGDQVPWKRLDSPEDRMLHKDLGGSRFGSPKSYTRQKKNLQEITGAYMKNLQGLARAPKCYTRTYKKKHKVQLPGLGLGWVSRRVEV